MRDDRTMPACCRAKQLGLPLLVGLFLGLNAIECEGWQTQEPAQMRGDLAGSTGIHAVDGFGLLSGIEASMWEVDPFTCENARIAIIDRSAVPASQIDTAPSDIGNWETSGVIDVTDLFFVQEGETLLLFNVQAHSIRAGGLIDGGVPGGNNSRLVEGGQLLFLESNFAGEAK